MPAGLPYRLRRPLCLTAVGLWVIAAVGMVLGSHAVNLEHYASVRHVECADHGEQVHIDSAARGVASESLGSLRNAPGAPDGEHHEHCEAVSAMRHEATAPDSAVTFTFVAPAVQAAGELPRTPWVRAAIYRSAPKTSPPASA